MQPLGTCTILINDKGQCLLGKRKNGYKAGWYGLPGGRFAHNEPLLDAAHREVLEETDLDLDELSYLGVVRESQEENDFIHFVFLAEVGTAKPKLAEPEKCEGWEWFHFDQLPEKLLPGHAAALNLYLDEVHLADVVQEEG